MSSSNNNKIISEARPHTIKKFELIEKYVEGWAYKLLGYDKCENLIFIDCMCNSGQYTNDKKKTIEGTGVRVANKLYIASKKYPTKNISIYLNDIDKRKTEHIKQLLPDETNNFKKNIFSIDSSEFLNKICPVLSKVNNTHTLLVYDPYDAAVDWEAVMPFFNTWGEVILNPMVSDTIRAINVAKKPETIKKYEKTYKTDFTNLLPFGSNRNAYEKKIEEIMAKMRLNSKREFYIASFPFFNRTNSVVYNLIHYTNNINGFSLFKKVAWQTFGGKSSDKNTYGNQNQLNFDFDNKNYIKTEVDEDCYCVKDIVDYIQNKFGGQSRVPLEQVWNILLKHPVFPSDGFRPEIKKLLKTNYEATIGSNMITFKK